MKDRNDKKKIKEKVIIRIVAILWVSYLVLLQVCTYNSPYI